MISKPYLSPSLILQTLQQLRDVYGESVDKIIQGNTENIVFLKSTDDSMIDTLVKMSGTTHEARVDQKTVSRDNERLLAKNEGKISYTMATKERPVIQFNDFMFIEARNSIVIKAGVSDELAFVPESDQSARQEGQFADDPYEFKCEGF